MKHTSEHLRNLRHRMQSIAQKVASFDGALALLATGSMGLYPWYADEYSDIDLLIVTHENHDPIIDSFSFLESISPISYQFRYNDNCIKCFFEDGIFCELSIIEENHMHTLAHSGFSVIWQLDHTELSYLQPQGYVTHPVHWLLGELETVLYTGVCKLQRGENLAALGYIEGRARELMCSIISQTKERKEPSTEDPFSKDRRFELAYPAIGEQLYRCFHGSEDPHQTIIDVLTCIDEHIQGFSSVVRHHILHALHRND